MTDMIIDNALRLYVERLERLIEEKKNITDDIKDVFLEAKATGFDVTIIRHWLKERKIDAATRNERDALIEAYGVQLKMFA